MCFRPRRRQGHLCAASVNIAIPAAPRDEVSLQEILTALTNGTMMELLRIVQDALTSACNASCASSPPLDWPASSNIYNALTGINGCWHMKWQ